MKRFTIVDGQNVEEADLGNNFFVNRNQMGRPRASACVELLMEMNPSSKGFAIEQDVHDFLQNQLESTC